MNEDSKREIHTMNEAYFQRVLRKALHDETISNVKILDKTLAGGKGVNFNSQLWRFNLQYACHESTSEFGNSIRKEIRLVVKVELTENNSETKTSNEPNIFNTELNVFDKILPETERLVKKRLSPKFFGGSKNPGIVILEDLEPLGFTMKDRQIGLSIDHTLMVLDAMAKFHAGSVYQCERNPGLVQSFTEGIMNERTPINIFRILEQTLQKVCDEIRCWPDPMYSRMADKLVVIKQKFAEEIVNVTNWDETEFCVLNHGDCWVNNIMFREDTYGKPLEVALIDYQMSVYSSPVIDLIYFLNLGPEIDLRGIKDDYFVEQYLRKLSESMRISGCKTEPPTLDQLEKAMLKRRMWAVMAALTLGPRMLADVSEIETFDQLIETGITNMNIFKNPSATIALRNILPIMDEKGYFD